MTTQDSSTRTVTAGFSAPVLRPTPDSVRGLALASVIANAVLVCTGAAVRLSSSGLGCPDWPRCTATSVVAAHSAGQTSLNTAIEFGNRLLTFPLAAIAALTFIAYLRYRPGGRRRRDLVRLSAALPGGVIAQALAGGLVVLTRLNPVMVAAHFLLSSAVLAAAVVLHARVGEGSGSARPLVRADLRVLAGRHGGNRDRSAGGHGHRQSRPPHRRAALPLRAPGRHPAARRHRLVHRRDGRRPGDRAAPHQRPGPGRPGQPHRARRADRAGVDRVRAVLQPPADRAGVGARRHVGRAVDLRAAAVPVHPRTPASARRSYPGGPVSAAGHSQAPGATLGAEEGVR
jgi:cytochrome oxidase assembly protein